jgi:hypothetical protein
MTSHEFALTLNCAVTESEIRALQAACGGDLDVETGQLGTIVTFRREAPTIRMAAEEAAEQVRTVIPRGWMLKTDA